MIFKKLRQFRDKILAHLVFWLMITGFLTFLFSVGVPGYSIGFNTVLMLLPVHILYYYILSKVVIPKYLYTRKFVKLGISFLLISACCTLAYRLIEICFADPYFFQEYQKYYPLFKWKKLNGTFSEQLLNKEYLMHAFEQSNSIVWIALMIKFVRMWYERKQVALHSELNFLKAQIHPHFLFNTLNNLYALTLNQSSKSPQVVLGLSEILRYMLYECNSDHVLLDRDIEIIKSYITLEKLRYEDRLDLNMTINGNTKGLQIAPLLMMPLIENAFKHGASEMMEEAWINIDLEINEKRLKVKVSNSYPGQQSKNGEIHYGKIGIGNVRKRLELLYPGAHHFNIYQEEDMYVVIMEIQLSLQSFAEVSKPSGKALILKPSMFQKTKTTRYK
mgnify:CR=1 FL=1